MFKRLMLILMFLAMGVQAYAAENQKVIETVATVDSVSTVGVPGTQTIYTKTLSARQSNTSEDIALMYKTLSVGTINIKIELEQSYVLPATEGAYDVNYVTTDLVKAALTDRDWKLATLDTVVMPYMRFKLTGGSGNTNQNLIMKVIK